LAKEEVFIVWYRQDLRKGDNPALFEAAKNGKVLAIYIYDDCPLEDFKMGGASKVWLYHSLFSLDKSLDGKLNIYQGNSSKIISALIKKYDVKGVYCNVCYEPHLKKQAREVFSLCKDEGVEFKAANANYLWKVTDLTKEDGSFYKVFTPFKNNALKIPCRKAIGEPKNLKLEKDIKNKTTLDSLDLIPKKKWYKKIENSWEIGEKAALKKLNEFMKHKVDGYKEGRDFPQKEQTSKLSPHLHFGEISPAQIYEKVSSQRLNLDKSFFISELIWREFSAYLLHFFPSLGKDNFNPKFDSYPWQKKSIHLKAWQKGQTGYPFVDAAMKELWHTGYMHNRARMVVASFLVKNLNIHWHKGRDWFWDCLVDADLSNNSASWQWVAGSGVDAAPFFRIFNPVTQGEKFDKEGEYVKKWIPELKDLPVKYIHKPWTAPLDILKSAGVELNKTYPNPIVDISISRSLALNFYKALSL
jgi:deoxyribodipyrimidine photo-lyase